MLQDAGSREIFGTSTFFLGNLVHGDAEDLLLCALPDRFLRQQRCLHALFCFFSGCACGQLLRAILCLVGRVLVVLPFLKLPKLQKKSGREISSCNGETHCDSDRKQPRRFQQQDPEFLTESPPRFKQSASPRLHVCAS